MLEDLGIPYRRPYQSRHTAATLWLASGESPEWVARQMGHTTTEMLFRVYSRYIPNLTHNDGSAFERLLARAIGGTVGDTESSHRLPRRCFMKTTEQLLADLIRANHRRRTATLLTDVLMLGLHIPVGTQLVLVLGDGCSPGQQGCRVHVGYVLSWMSWAP
jgi:hypothetical protein